MLLDEIRHICIECEDICDECKEKVKSKDRFYDCNDRKYPCKKCYKSICNRCKSKLEKLGGKCDHSELSINITEYREQIWKFRKEKGEWEQTASYFDDQDWKNAFVRCSICDKAFKTKEEMDLIDWELNENEHIDYLVEKYNDCVYDKFYDLFVNDILRDFHLTHDNIKDRIESIRVFDDFIIVYYTFQLYDNMKLPIIYAKDITKEFIIDFLSNKRKESGEFKHSSMSYERFDKYIKEMPINTIRNDYEYYVVENLIQRYIIDKLLTLKTITIKENNIDKEIPIKVFIRFYYADKFINKPINILRMEHKRIKD